MVQDNLGHSGMSRILFLDSQDVLVDSHPSCDTFGCLDTTAQVSRLSGISLDKSGSRGTTVQVSLDILVAQALLYLKYECP